MVKKLLLAVLTATIIFHAPWRLMLLTTEVFAVTPGYTELSKSNDGYWSALNLEARLIRLGYRVQYAGNLNMNGRRSYGITDPSGRMIYIDEDLGWHARYAILAHEGGHTLQPWRLNETQGEVFAETVAALVTRDDLWEHARYLAAVKADYLMMVLAFWPEMYRAAAFLEGA